MLCPDAISRFPGVHLGWPRHIRAKLASYFVGFTGQLLHAVLAKSAVLDLCLLIICEFNISDRQGALGHIERCARTMSHWCSNHIQIRNFWGCALLLCDCLSMMQAWVSPSVAAWKWHVLANQVHHFVVYVKRHTLVTAQITCICRMLAACKPEHNVFHSTHETPWHYRLL